MPKQEEIKAAMATYFAFREPTRSGMATIRLPSRPSAKETTAAAFVLAEAYIEEHDDTPIAKPDYESIIAKLVEALDDSNALLETIFTHGVADDDKWNLTDQIADNKAAIKAAEGK